MTVVAQPAHDATATGPAAGSIRFESVSKWFDNADNVVLDRIDLHVEAAAFVSIIGASGCGKSTLLRTAADLADCSSGSVLVNGQPPSVARQEHQIGFVFQAPNLCPWRTVRRNVELPLETMKVAKGDRRQRALDQLQRVGLAEAGDRYPAQLSGGMAQRVAIARALVFDPPIVLMDEPFGALDEITRDRLNIELHELWRRTHKTIVFVTHSIAEAVLLSTQIVVMSRRPGRVARIIDVGLPERRDLTTATTPEFYQLVTEVRTALVDSMGPVA